MIELIIVASYGLLIWTCLTMKKRLSDFGVEKHRNGNHSNNSPWNRESILADMVDL